MTIFKRWKLKRKLSDLIEKEKCILHLWSQDKSVKFYIDEYHANRKLIEEIEFNLTQ